MTTAYAIALSVGAVIATAALEGICAGDQVKPFYAQLRFPRYSAPLWVWAIIGAMYYAIFGLILYRVLRLEAETTLRMATLALILFMMVANALANLVIFRRRDLRMSFLIGAVAPVFDLALLACLLGLDARAAWALAPYLGYRVYGVWWGYEVWRLNPSAPS